MIDTRKRQIRSHHSIWNDRAGLIVAITMIASLLSVPDGLIQRVTAQGAQEVKLGLGDLIKKANQSVVQTNIQKISGQKIGFGSGFLIDDQGPAATNLHLVRQSAETHAAFESKDGNTVGVKCLRACNKKRDLAILQLDNVPPTARPLPLGLRAGPAPGDTVTAFGLPQRLNFKATSGIVSEIRKTSDCTPFKPEEDSVFVQI